MKKIVCVIGTRPQLIKHSVLLQKLKKKFTVQTVNTLQHYQYELNDLLKEELYDNAQFDTIELNHEISPAERLGQMISGLDKVIDPTANCILCYGDTDTTLAAALTANKMNKTLVHVEAGERSFNNKMPEEQNRIIVGHLADFHFCSSEEAVTNLQAENITENVFYVGDLMKDLLTQSLHLPSPCSDNYIFCTIHRSYNKNNPEKLKELLHALSLIPKSVHFSMHPATLACILNHGIDLGEYRNITFLPPLSYKQCITYQKFADAIVTDSGGIQKEAYWLKRPCITIRKESEWKVTLKGNWNQLLYEKLECLIEFLKNTPEEHEYKSDLYGDGKSAEKIASILTTLI